MEEKEIVFEDKVWRAVPSFVNKYYINIDTKEGKCWSVTHKKPLSNRPNKKTGRIYWGLCKDGQETVHQAARWIALTYPELVQNEYFEGAEIMHEDNNVLNNHPSNLKWGTHRENMRNQITREIHKKVQTGKKHTKEAKKKMSKNKINHPTLSEPVMQYSLNGEYIDDYPSIAEAERQNNGVKHTLVSLCCQGKRKTHAGFIWKYKEKEAS